MSALRQLGGNATRLGIKSAAPSLEGEIVGQLFVASNIAVGSNAFIGSAQLNVWGTAVVTSDLTTNKQILASVFSPQSTAAAPAYSFSNDSLTGLFQPQTSTLAVSTAGSERLRVDSSGRLGVNNTNPQTQLDMNGQFRVRAQLNSAGNPGASQYAMIVSQSNALNTEVAGEATGVAFQRSTNNADIGGKILFVSDASGSGRGDFSFQLKNTATTGDSSTAILHLKNNGAVGINTSSPTSTLDIVGTSIRLSHATLPISTTLNNKFDIGYAVTASNFSTASLTGDTVIRSVDAGSKIHFQIGTQTPGFTLSSNQIGIGTTITQAPLTIRNETAATPKVLFTNDTLTNRHIVLHQTADNEHEFIGVGVNASLLRSQVNASSTSFGWFAAASASSSTELMRLTGTGKLGIGTNAPDTNLHVVGITTVSSNVLVGGQNLATTTGSVSSPSFSWQASPSTGFFRPEVNTIGVTIEGTEFFRFSSNQVGVGTVTVSTGYVQHTWGNQIIGKTTSAATRLVLDGPALQKYVIDTSANSLSFGVHDSTNAADYTTFKSHVYINSNGALCINAPTAPSNTDKLYVYGVSRFASNVISLQKTLANSNQNTPVFTFLGNETTGMYQPLDNTLSFSANNVERLRLHASGDMSLRTNTAVSGREVTILGKTFIGEQIPSQVSWADTSTLVLTNSNNQICSMALQCYPDSNTGVRITNQSNALNFYSPNEINFFTQTSPLPQFTIEKDGTIVIAEPNLSGAKQLKYVTINGLGANLLDSQEFAIITPQDVGNLSYFLYLTAIQNASSNFISKGYFVPVKYNVTAGVWKRITPTNSSGPDNGNDFEVEMNTSNDTTRLRVVRTATGFSPSGIVNFIFQLDRIRGTTLYVTESGATGTNAQNAGIYPYTPVSYSGGSMSIGINSYNGVFNVGASNTGNSIDANQDGAGDILHLRSNSVVVARFTKNGSLGIGTTPTESLHIIGTGIISSNLSLGNRLLLDTAGTAIVPTLAFQASPTSGLFAPNTDTLGLSTSSTERIRITAGGRVGIGTQSPNSTLHVHGAMTVSGSNIQIGTSNFFGTPTNSSTNVASNCLIRVQNDVFQSTTTLTSGTIKSKDLSIIGSTLEGSAFNNVAPYTTAPTVTVGSVIVQGGSYHNTDFASTVANVKQYAGHVYLRGGTSTVQSGAANAVTEHGSVIFETGTLAATQGNVNTSPDVFVERARIDGKTGFIGVGTSAPLTNLHVVGNGLFASNVTAASFTTIAAIPNATVSTGYLLMTEGSNLRASRTIQEDTSGNMGLGIAPNASYKLGILGAQRNDGNLLINSGGRLAVSTITDADRKGLLTIGTSNVSAVPKIYMVPDLTTRRHISMWDESLNDENRFIGFGVSNNTLIYQVNSTTANHRFYAGGISSSTELMCILGEGRVGLGTATPASLYKMEVIGTVKADNFISLSDRTTKENIEQLDSRTILANLENLNGYEYSPISQKNQRRYGLIAQEVETVFPHAVTTASETGLKAVAYPDLVAVLLEAIKELKSRVDKLEKERTAL